MLNNPYIILKVACLYWCATFILNLNQIKMNDVTRKKEHKPNTLLKLKETSKLNKTNKPRSVMDAFDNNWLASFGYTILKQMLGEISSAVLEERKSKVVLPEQGSNTIFNAFKLTPFNKVRVVIVGQDPYHDGSYNGLAFGNGNPDDHLKKVSPSLLNIAKEVKRSYNLKSLDSFDFSLYHWAKQGVLLINTAHTVVKGFPGSHLELWHDFTAFLFEALQNKPNVVWLLWGRQAQLYKELITNPTHTILNFGHPSPLNRTNPFVGSDCFKICDNVLTKKSKVLPPISWYLK